MHEPWPGKPAMYGPHQELDAKRRQRRVTPAFTSKNRVILMQIDALRFFAEWRSRSVASLDG